MALVRFDIKKGETCTKDIYCETCDDIVPHLIEFKSCDRGKLEVQTNQTCKHCERLHELTGNFPSHTRMVILEYTNFCHLWNQDI